MKIMRANLYRRGLQQLQQFSLHMHNSILVLKLSPNLQKLSSSYQHPLALAQFRGNDDIRNSRLIFDRKQDESLCRPRPLPRNHSPGSDNPPPIRLQAQFAGRRHAMRLSSRRR
jgi:hypothetical protein